MLTHIVPYRSPPNLNLARSSKFVFPSPELALELFYPSSSSSARPHAQEGSTGSYGEVLIISFHNLFGS